MENFLEIRNIQKRFGSQTALSSVNLRIRRGEFFSLLGPSGCGKSTLLRLIAGLETADAGEILCEGQPIGDKPARERPFNMVFQRHALFPHLSVFENIAFGLRIKKVPRKLPATEIETRVRETLKLVSLEGFENRLPETLSGGQSQRVALARALVNRPSCVLLDEPLASLDLKLREQMQSELRDLQKRLGLTFIFVTHDQEEALSLSDRIAVMSEGCVEQVATPEELFEQPSTAFSASFIGRRNEFSGAMIAIRDGQAEFSIGPARVKALISRGIGQDGAHRVFVRPEKITLCSLEGAPKNDCNTLEGEVSHVVFRGNRFEVFLRLSGQGLARVSTESSDWKLKVGTRARLEFSYADTHVFPAPTEQPSESPKGMTIESRSGDS